MYCIIFQPMIIITMIITSSSGRTYYKQNKSTQLTPSMLSRKLMLEINNQPTLRNHLDQLFISGLSSIISYNKLGSLDKITNDFKTGENCEDVNLSIDKLIVKYGYPMEKHHTVTEDGYNLTMFRIPSDGPVVFMLHGMFGSADSFVVGGPNVSLPYLLANEGYDVWLGNARGTKHSRSHVKLKPSQEKFWDFTWHESGYYDLPAMIDYTLRMTEKAKLKFIGYSQGSTSFFVMASERPEYNDKISLMVAMAPAAFMANIKSPIVTFFASFHRSYLALSKATGIHEILQSSAYLKSSLQTVIGTNTLVNCLTSILILSVCSDVSQMNVTNLPVIISHEPSGSSVQQIIHYAQLITSKKFSQFDHGVDENLKRYGTQTPPDYDLTKITVPVSLLYSDGDWIVEPDDIDKLSQILPNVVGKHKLRYKFKHFDYVFAKDLKNMFFKRLRKILLKY